VIGTSLGQYDVEALLGEGGMGRVFRARDTRLGRAVAIKVLPDAFRANADRAARFEREAKLLAALNHPHIAALYGFEDIDGQRFLVMELIEGDTLADRLTRGPLRIEDAIRVALQIAEALEAAHEKGIIHRDLKPANIKLTTDDKIKVLDFGLAKALEPEGAATGLTNSPTLSLAATHAGVVLGTAAYMSPEQAKGLPADHRSDIFSFGAVLHEMLTGREPFQGETAAEVMASVIVRETDLSLLPADLHPRIGELLKRCLEKSPRKRWQAIGDVRAELEAIAAAPRLDRRSLDALRGEPRPLWRRALIPTLTALGAAAVSIAVMSTRTPRAPAPTVTRFTFPLGEGQALSNPGRSLIAMSPDGTKLIYVANQRLWLRSLSELEARPIAGSGPFGQGVTGPVFSPDGQSVLFYSLTDQVLKRVPTAGGTAVTLAAMTNPYGVSWQGNDIYVGQGPGGIARMSNGGAPETIIRPAANEVMFGPQLLPGGEWLLFTLTTGTGLDRWDKAQVVVQSLRSQERRTLLDGATDARYLSSGHLAYAVRGTIFAVAFDASTLQMRGGPGVVLEGVAQSSGLNTGAAHWSVSELGTAAYIPGSVSAGTSPDLAYLDRSGAFERLNLPSHAYSFPRRSPDGRRLAIVIEDEAENLWVHDLNGGTAMSRLTFGGGNRHPVWTPDSQYLTFQSDRDGDQAIWRQRADRPGAAERLTRPENGSVHVPHAWSTDGNTLLYSIGDKQRFALWTHSLRDQKASPFEDVASGYQLGAVLSPDGRWVAYHTNDNERGTNTLFVRPFPPNGALYQVATGANPVWSTDGKELLWVSGPGSPFHVGRVAIDGGFRLAGTPAAISRPRVLGFDAARGRNFDSAPDGKLIVAVASSESIASATTISVVLNWFTELKARVPAW
jgi:serine/threonine-protein kinase